MKQSIKIIYLKKFKKLFLFIVFCSSLSSFAQEWTTEIKKADPNFYDLQTAFNNYYKAHPPGWNSDDDYKAFKRWEFFMAPRVYPTGKFTNANATWEALRSRAQNANKTSRAVPTASWTSLGPQSTLNGIPGVGRIDCIKFDPTNANTMWVGAAGGGLWKSTNQGNNWTDMNTNLPNLSIADIAINPGGTNTMYIATGDGYGYTTGFVFWGGSYSNGVLKSTDGGVTWNSTGLNYNVGQNQIINRLIIHPNNHDTLIAVGNNGINRTVNGGTTWSQVQAGTFYDIEFKPNNPNIIFASSNQIYKSINGGATWAVLPTSPLFVGRVAIETTAANSNVIYAMDEVGTCYKSINAGVSWSATAAPPVTLYGYYDDVLSVSPINENIVYAAGFDMALTLDGGATWSNPLGTIHADNHAMEFVPATNNIFSGNDGGIYMSTDNGGNWTDYTSGLGITQIYRIGSSASNPSLVFAGAQDNGTNKYTSGTWIFVETGDGTECLVDYNDPNIVYISWQNGNFEKSTNGGSTLNSINPGGGAWISPMIMHPTNSSILYFGGQEVGKSIDGGNTWNNISTNLTGGSFLTALAVARSNPNYIYASTELSVYSTNNGGTSWNSITSNLPVGLNIITAMAVSATDPNAVWVTLSGYNTGQKVFKTSNGGTSWTNVSTGLPAIPANCIVYDNSSINDALFVGTDLGVYYTDNTLSGWQQFNTGLPNVIIDELEINYTSQKLLAGTYGRGLWETPIVGIITGKNISTSNTKSTISLYPNPNKGSFNLDVNSVAGETSVKIEILNLIGQKVFSASDDSVLSKQYNIDLSGYAPGVYIVNINTAFESRTQKIVMEN